MDPESVAVNPSSYLIELQEGPRVEVKPKKANHKNCARATISVVLSTAACQTMPRSLNIFGHTNYVYY